MFFKNLKKKNVAQDRCLEDGVGVKQVFKKSTHIDTSEERVHANDISLAFDKESVRSFDEDGRMRVQISNISKAMVCPYYGEEIPNYQELGLEPTKIYQLLRDPAELEKSVPTWNGIPVLNEHTPVSAEDHKPKSVVGSTGTDAAFESPYLVNSLSIWSQDAIDKIESGEQTEISCSYYYDPVMTAGEYEGIPYDGIMTNLRANHVALVSKGRAGPDVLVNDGEISMSQHLSRKALLAKGVLMAVLKPGKVALDSMLTGVTNSNWLHKKPGIIGKVKAELANDADLGDVVKLLDALDKEQPEDDNLGMDDMEEMDNMSADADPRCEEILDKLRGKISDEDLDAVKSMLYAETAAEDDKPETANASEGALAKEKKEETPVEAKAMDDKDEDDKKMDKAAMDKAINAAVKIAEDRTIDRLRKIHEAEEIIKPYVGKLAAMDSAEDYYRSALKLLKVDVKGVHASAFKTILQMRPNPNETRKPVAAQDHSISSDMLDQFPNLK